MAYKFKVKRGEAYAEGCFDEKKRMSWYNLSSNIKEQKGGIKSQNIGKADY